MTPEDIIRRFSFRHADREALAKQAKIQSLYLGVARELANICPHNRELALCLTRMEESLSWAVESVKRE